MLKEVLKNETTSLSNLESYEEIKISVKVNNEKL